MVSISPSQYFFVIYLIAVFYFKSINCNSIYSIIFQILQIPPPHPDPDVVTQQEIRQITAQDIQPQYIMFPELAQEQLQDPSNPEVILGDRNPDLKPDIAEIIRQITRTHIEDPVQIHPDVSQRGWTQKPLPHPHPHLCC